MAEKLFIGGGYATKRQITYTPNSVVLNEYYGFTWGNYRVRVQATTATAAYVCDALYAAMAEAPLPLRRGAALLDVADPAGGGTITVTSSSSGFPFDLETTATGGGSWHTPTIVAAGSGPFQLNDPNNWDGGVAPSSGDDWIFGAVPADVFYNLEAYEAYEVPRLVVRPSNISVGLLRAYATSGGSKAEQPSPRYLKAEFGEIVIGDVTGIGATTTLNGLVRIHSLNRDCTVKVLATGASAENGLAAVELIGLYRKVEVLRGSVGIAMDRGATAQVDQLVVRPVAGLTEAIVNGGEGAIVGVIEQHSGAVGWRGTCEQWNKYTPGSVQSFDPEETAPILGGSWHYRT